jgi:DNA-directed RNA polymerase subunit F|tara:strand:+ start:607 stop:969 length:363 start_codon:yes stop_codon:yes gene_type:complete
MSKEEFVDVATVRDLLLDAQKRRGELSYEQTMALQHAEWSASNQGHPTGTLKTDTKVFNELYSKLMENEKLIQYPEISAKLAELCPMLIPDFRVVIASKRIAMDTSEIEELIDVIKQHVL